MKNDRGDPVLNLFAPKRQYRIPLYQRHYVWDRNNWDTLWTDIEAKLDCRRNSEEPFNRHFTGTILTYQDRSEDNLLPPYQILDGQQRLITFQIILCAIRDICLSNDYTVGSGSRVPSPDSLIKYQGSDKRYNKLCPKEGFDEKAFRALAAPEETQEEPSENHLIHRAYRYFKCKIQECVEENFAEIDLLYEAVVLDFDMVQINLKDRGDLEKIFASLNATGRMLDEFDRLRMDLFLRAGKNEDRLYRDHWMHFDTECYWEKGGKSEIFFQHFLQAKVDPACFQTQDGKEVKAFDVYLKQYWPMLEPHQGIDYEFRQLKKYSRVYQKMNDPYSDIGQRMKFYNEFEIDSLHPFILYIISEFSEFSISEDEPENECVISAADLELIFDILESYMMRRMLRWGSEDRYKVVNSINDFFCKMREEKHFSLMDFLNHLTKSSNMRHEDQWTTNREVELALTERWHVEKGMRYILYRIELERRKEEKIPEKIDFTEGLILHYIMPEKWENSWLLEGPDGSIQFKALFSDEYKTETRSWFDRPSQRGLIDESYLKAFTLAQDRKNRRRSVGNLTLVDEVGNQTKFDEKKQYFADSKFMISNDIANDYEDWDASQIDHRAEKLIKYFDKIWKYSNWYRKEYLSKKYDQGTRVRGTVTKVSNKGIYLQLEEGIEGRIDLSEMTWAKLLPKRVEFSEFTNIDDEIEAKVLEISNHHKQIPLSLKQLQPNPWKDLELRYSVGMRITGYITHIHDFGAYVKIDQQGIEGRIYNENLSWDPRATARELLKKGDEVEVEVLRIDVSKQLILLGHKQTKPDPWNEVPEKYKVGSVIRVQIVDLTNFGAFAEIEKGVEGLIHISELTDREIEKPEEMVWIGEELDVKVINVSLENRRIGLSLKAVIANGSKATPQWVSMIESQTIIFTTYRGRRQLSQIKVSESEVVGLSNKNKKLKFNVKKEILFAYSLEAFQVLQDHIPRWDSVKTQKTEEFEVDDATLKSAVGIQVKATTRSTHELQGIIEGFDEDAIYMQIKKQKVIVFRHGLCDFITEQE